MNDITTNNKTSWNAIADEFDSFSTALPKYGVRCPTEDELHLFPDLHNKKVIDIGCGSGKSLKWCADQGASELWGLDISERQLELATKCLTESGYAPKLFNSPMEQNPGLPENYFDVAYQVYSIGWTADLKTTFNLISSYLKKDGIFILSWDHPINRHVSPEDEKLVFQGNYFNPVFKFEKWGNPLTMYNHRFSDYINTLVKAGFAIEQIVEETDKETLNSNAEFSDGYYAPFKAKKIPLSIIIKTRKI